MGSFRSAKGAKWINTLSCKLLLSSRLVNVKHSIHSLLSVLGSAFYSQHAAVSFERKNEMQEQCALKPPISITLTAH